MNPGRRILAETIQKLSTPRIKGAESIALETGDIVWALGSFSALNQIPFDPALLLPELPAAGSVDALLLAARKLGFRCRRVSLNAASLPALTFPSLIFLKDQNTEDGAEHIRPAILVRVANSVVTYFKAGTNVPVTDSCDALGAMLAGFAIQIAPGKKPLSDPDGRVRSNTGFGFSWFIAELLKYKSVWRDVLIASLAIQLLALGTPLFTQVVIDKVVVHRTESTLLVIGIGLAIFMMFTALLTWVRQYLVLHTGNRVDAVLGSAVFSRLFKLPPRYFEHRPTGVIAARLRGVENIREFISSAAVTLVLDLPFLLIFVAIMFVYNVKLTFVVLGLIVLVGIVTTIVAPIFRNRLNEQFLIGARNQAFVTEYISGLETVKSLQLEPQIEERYSTYLAEYMSCGFGVKQIGNTYNVFANGVEQLMTLLVLVLGAYTVMHDPQFTIGMLVAFQMFAGRVSQPMLRMVGLWQQYQQASLSVARLGDIMDVAPEPYSIVPFRATEAKGRIDVKGLSFRYSDKLPLLYRDFNLTLLPGKTVAVMGPSGSGKSTMAKLLLAFYQPTEGSISIDGNDIRNCSANELRRNFGVVPQETVLFSGTVYDNLIMANPHATFDDVVNACRMAEIHDAIEKLAEGYKTEIGERGAGLSGGQKQRIAIARALLKRPKVLIFDEATSSLDSQTAEHFATTVNSLRGKVTMLFITHHLPEVLKVDQIVRIGPLQSVDSAELAEVLPAGELA